MVRDRTARRMRAFSERMARRILCALLVLWSWSLALAQGVAPDLRTVEIVGPADPPSEALRAQLAKGEDSYLWFDVGYGVRSAVVRMHDEWREFETLRAGVMEQVVTAMRTRLADASPADAACAGVAAAAAELLDCAAIGAPAPSGVESAEVWRGSTGTMRFLPDRRSWDWHDARPAGAYAAQGSRVRGLYRATVYLATYLRLWPEATAARWRELARACHTTDIANDFALASGGLAILFGWTLEPSGVPQVPPDADRDWLREHAGDADEPRTRLHRMLVDLAAVEWRAINGGMLRLCHQLAIAPADDPMLGELTPAQWRAKWSDAATFAYTGLREVDCFGCCSIGVEPRPRAPRVLIEPLAAVWHVLQLLDQRCDDLVDLRFPKLGSGVSRVEPVLQALAVQARGEELDAKLNDQLVGMLLHGFEATDRLIDTPTTVDGIGGFRRAKPQFVRIPVRWRGEVVRALALRLYIEHQDA